MQDHGLFQAICRVNRLHGDDKEYGYIIDYKDLFRSLEGAIKDYTGEAFDGCDRADVEGLLKDRLEQGRERLEETREAVKALCEPVEPPRDSDAYRHYFCDAGKGLAANERKRLTLYRAVAAFVRAYANLANEMTEAGYTEAERQTIRDEVGHYEKVRQEIKLASGDYVDLKVFEPAMRHLLDNYIRAEDSEVISKFDDMTLVDLLIRDGEGAIGSLPEAIRGSRRAVAETIENNVRRLIVDEMAVNPKYYEKMSAVLDALIQRRREEAIEYEDYLKKVIELAEKVKRGEGGGRIRRVSRRGRCGRSMTTCRRRCWGRRWRRGVVGRNLTGRPIRAKWSRWLWIGRFVGPGWRTGAIIPSRRSGSAPRSRPRWGRTGR